MQDVRDKHRVAMDAAPAEQRLDMLCELNVIEQVINVCHSTVMKDAWHRGHADYGAWLDLWRARWLAGRLAGGQGSLAELEALYDAAIEQVFKKNRAVAQ